MADIEPIRGLLERRKVAIGIFVFCLCSSVLSWRRIARPIQLSHSGLNIFGHHFSHDPTLIFGLAFSTFVVASVALSSPLRADRFVFGAAAFSFGLSVITQFAVFSSLLSRPFAPRRQLPGRSRRPSPQLCRQELNTKSHLLQSNEARSSPRNKGPIRNLAFEFFRPSSGHRISAIWTAAIRGDSIPFDQVAVAMN